jgi:hypothetical protein
MDAVRLDVDVLDIWELVPNERLEPAHRALIRPSAIRGNQGQLEATPQSEAIRGNPRQSDAITPVNLGAQEDAVELVDREEEGLCLDGGLG